MGRLKYLDTQKGLMFLWWGGDESLSRSSSGMTTGGRAQLWTGEMQQWEGPPPFQVTASHLLPDSTAFHPQCWIPPKSQKAYCTAPSNSRLVVMADVWSEITRCSKEIFTKGSCSCVLLIHAYAGKQLRYQTSLSDA